MKKILITGKNSYIGTSVEKYLTQWPEEYSIDTLDVHGDSWKKHDFSQYDVVYHVAGIAHQKETKENASLYYEINRDLAVNIAKKAKVSKVKQFIFMSSMSVYGLIYSKETINLKTPTMPVTNYGKSKLEAEQEILNLGSKDFLVTVLRPPMVYGDAAPGNMNKLISLVSKIHVFPTFKNERSAIKICKLCEEIKLIIDRGINGILLPQDDTYMCTYEIVKKICDDRKIILFETSMFNKIISFLIGRQKEVTKIFGDLKYEKNFDSNNNSIHD